jgi:L-malate glycosyltransferase
VSDVHQVLAGVGPYDAVSEQARVWRRLLLEAGFGGGDHAVRIDSRVHDGFEGLHRLRPARDDLVVIRFSAWSPPLTPLASAPWRRLLHFHNVTPASYLWNHAPLVAVQCEVARVQLPAFARSARVCTADSEFNAAELRAAGAKEARVVPIAFDPSRLEEREDPPVAGGTPLVLCVGRLAPNKRHDLIFRAFAELRRECAPGARLLCVGEPINPPYGALLERLAAESGAGDAIELAGPLAQAQVNAAYAAADVLIHLSEHEGFCIPLLEAFHFGVPVVARPTGAMPAVGGDAVLWTETDPDPAVTAELLALATGDSGLRAELVRRGRERLTLFTFEDAAAAALGAVRDALA